MLNAHQFSISTSNSKRSRAVDLVLADHMFRLVMGKNKSNLGSRTSLSYWPTEVMCKRIWFPIFNYLQQRRRRNLDLYHLRLDRWAIPAPNTFHWHVSKLCQKKCRTIISGDHVFFCKTAKLLYPWKLIPILYPISPNKIPNSARNSAIFASVRRIRPSHIWSITQSKKQNSTNYQEHQYSRSKTVATEKR